jgi:hypothetical protein
MVMTQVRRSPRHNADGHRHQVVPVRALRSKSKVAKAVAPEVLQVAEMQRLGVEECHIDPEELSEERLHMEREASKD